MSKPSNDEIAQALGREQLKGAKEAGKEAVVGDTKMQELKALIDKALMTPAAPISVQVSRRVALRTKFNYIGTIDYIDTPTLSNYGIMYIVQDFSGGGDYECLVKVSGLEDATVYFSIEGPPLPPKPERLLQQSQPQQPVYNNPPQHVFSGQQQHLPVGASIPWTPGFSQPGLSGVNPLNPAYQQMLAGGYNPYQQQQQQAQNQPIDKMLTLFEKMMNEQRELLMNTGEDPEKKRLEEEIRSSNRRFEKLEEDRRRDAEQHRSDEKFAAMERRHQELLEAFKNDSKPKTDTSVEIAKALAPIASIVLPLLITRGDDQAKNMSELFRGVVDSQRAAAETQSSTFKTLLDRPGPEDRLIKVSEAVAKNMASNVGLVGTLLNGVLAEKGGDNPPPWLQVVSQLIDTGGAVAESLLGGAFADGDGANPAARPLQPPPTHNAQARIIERGAMDAAQAGQEARNRVLGRGMPTPKQMAHEASEAAQTVAATEVTVGPQIEQFDTAMQTIFTMIAQGGDPNEIAFRLWKHAASGVRLANDWFTNPEEGTPAILNALRAGNQLTVDDARINQVTVAIREFYNYLSGGGQPEDYVSRHKINARMPRSTRTVITRPTDAEFGEHQESHTPVGSLKIIEQPPETAPTPIGSTGPVRVVPKPVAVDHDRIEAMTEKARASEKRLQRPPIAEKEEEKGKKEEEEEEVGIRPTSSPEIAAINQGTAPVTP